MRLSSLHLMNFRNHGDFKCSLPEGAVFVSGANGAGKTALIESIFLLLSSRSFKGHSFADIKKKAEPYLRIEASFEAGNFHKALLFYETEKKFLVDGAAYDLAQFSRSLPFVCYSPEYESYFSDNHAERRAFMDRMVFYADASHLDLVRKYNSLLLRKRTELLKERPDKELVEIYNAQMLPYSQEISSQRQTLAEEVNTLCASAVSCELFMPNMQISLNVSSLENRDAMAEIAAGRPLYGCHKDLLYMKENGKAVEKFRSFGQKKSTLLFLLYHTACYLRNKRQDDILILLDDFEAGLDSRRCQELDRLFSDSFQIIMTGLEPKAKMENIQL